MSVNNSVDIERSYVDNYAVKDFTNDVLVDKYFPDIDVSTRTVGMIGMTSEIVSNIAEDTFNTGTVYLRETFPNRAEIKESIYSHAALFQLSDVFSKAGECQFLIVLGESGIIDNMTYDSNSGFYYFYLDKDTVTYVKETPFVLDYDIQIKIAKKKNDYLFTATYVLDSYNNSISSIKNPFIKLSRSNNGYIALTVTMHQCLREISYEPIISNTKINLPIIDVKYEGKLAGFDILYKSPNDTDFSTQLTTQVVYSQPLKTPFCYYQMADTATSQILRLTFNSKDAYFMPAFNSELKIILYITDGLEGNFKEYTGTDITITPSHEVYNYSNPYDIATKTLGGCTGGSDQLGEEALQALCVESYRTANALTTEADLDEYFSNYKYRYGDNVIKFIKKRDDIDERLFSAYTIIQNGDKIFRTNVLNLAMNIYEMKNTDTNIFMLEPGTLLTYDEKESLYAAFIRDKEKYERYYAEYQDAVAKGTTPFLDENTDYDNPPIYLLRPTSFAQFKSRKGYDDKLSVFDLTQEELELMDDPHNGKFLYMNPFLIRFVKSPNIITYYLTTISQNYMLDFIDQNEDSFVQFIAYDVQIGRKFEKEKKFHISLSLMSSIAIDSDYPPIDTVVNTVVKEDEFGDKTEEKEVSFILNDKYNVRNNDLRILFVIKKNGRYCCYTELYPTSYDGDTTFTFEGDIFTDDTITSDGYLRIEDGEIYRDIENGDYYLVDEDDYTKYNFYDANGVLKETEIPVDYVTQRLNNGEVEKWYTTINMEGNDRIQIPMTDVSCEIYTLYKRSYDADSSSLVINTINQTNNNFVTFDKSYSQYIWTNIYSTDSNPVTFIKPLTSLRSYLDFDDYTQTDQYGNYRNDIFDAHISSVPLVYYGIAKNDEDLTYFMNSFYKQYSYITDVINDRLRTISNIDVKFYNTYGKSKNFYIGDNEEVINTINLKMEMDIWFITGGNDISEMKSEIKTFIMKQVKDLSSGTINNLFMSNLMRKIETNFSYVDHIRFVSINGYPTEYQSVKNKTKDLNELTRDERRVYVPEILVIEEDDITINEYTA